MPRSHQFASYRTHKMDDDDLRARLDAQIAARRAAGQVAGQRQRRRAVRGSHAIRDRPTGQPLARDRSRTRRFVGPVGRLVLVLALAAVFTFVLRTFVVEPFYVPSGSMEPTLHGCAGCRDDYLLVDKISYHLHSVNRGDVVVFSRPAGVAAADAVLVKRVIATGGQQVDISNGKVYVNGKALVEPYVNHACAAGTTLGTEPATVTVPKGDVWVMGDNRCDSQDSRYFGPIKASTIIGRAFIVVWPLGRIHWL